MENKTEKKKEFEKYFNKFHSYMKKSYILFNSYGHEESSIPLER